MSQMLPESRRHQILEALRSQGTLRVTDLARLLGVSPVTARRDVNQLARDGVIRRVHGGAVLASDADTREADREEPRADGAGTVGMLVPSLDYYWPDVVQGARDEARRRGLRLVLRGTSYESSDDRAQVTHLLNSGVDGLLLAPDTGLPETAAMLQWLEAARVPVALVERDARSESSHAWLDSVNTDHGSGVGSAVRFFAEQGHRDLGLVLSRKSPHSDEIRAAWEMALAEVDVVGHLVEALDNAREPQTAGQVDALLAGCRDQGVTGLLVHADREAIAIVQRSQEAGRSVPADLSIIAYDDEVAGLFTPPLTAVRPPRTSIGRAAVQLLADRLRDPDRPIHRVVVSPELNVRESVSRRDVTHSSH